MLCSKQSSSLCISLVSLGFWSIEQALQAQTTNEREQINIIFLQNQSSSSEFVLLPQPTYGWRPTVWGPLFQRVQLQAIFVDYSHAEANLKTFLNQPIVEWRVRGQQHNTHKTSWGNLCSICCRVRRGTSQRNVERNNETSSQSLMRKKLYLSIYLEINREHKKYPLRVIVDYENVLSRW